MCVLKTFLPYASNNVIVVNSHLLLQCHNIKRYCIANFIHWVSAAFGSTNSTCHVNTYPWCLSLLWSRTGMTKVSFSGSVVVSF